MALNACIVSSASIAFGGSSHNILRRRNGLANFAELDIKPCLIGKTYNQQTHRLTAIQYSQERNCGALSIRLHQTS